MSQFPRPVAVGKLGRPPSMDQKKNPSGNKKAKRHEKTPIQSHGQQGGTDFQRFQRFISGEYLLDEWSEHSAERLKVLLEQAATNISLMAALVLSSDIVFLVVPYSDSAFHGERRRDVILKDIFGVLTGLSTIFFLVVVLSCVATTVTLKNMDASTIKARILGTGGKRFRINSKKQQVEVKAKKNYKVLLFPIRVFNFALLMTVAAVGILVFVTFGLEIVIAVSVASFLLLVKYFHIQLVLVSVLDQTFAGSEEDTSEATIHATTYAKKSEPLKRLLMEAEKLAGDTSMRLKHVSEGLHMHAGEDTTEELLERAVHRGKQHKYFEIAADASSRALPRPGARQSFSAAGSHRTSGARPIGRSISLTNSPSMTRRSGAHHQPATNELVTTGLGSGQGGDAKPASTDPVDLLAVELEDVNISLQQMMAVSNAAVAKAADTSLPEDQVSAIDDAPALSAEAEKNKPDKKKEIEEAQKAGWSPKAKMGYAERASLLSNPKEFSAWGVVYWWLSLRSFLNGEYLLDEWREHSDPEKLKKLLTDALINISLVAALMLSVCCTFLVVPTGGGSLGKDTTPRSFYSFGILMSISVMIELICILSCVRTLMSLDALDGEMVQRLLVEPVKAKSKDEPISCPQIILFPIRLFTLSMIITVAATGILVQALFNTHVTIAVVIVAGTTLIIYLRHQVKLVQLLYTMSPEGEGRDDDALYQTFADTLEEAAKILRNAALATRPGMKDNTKNLPAEGKSSTEDNANLIAIRKQCLESSKATQQILLDMGEMYQILCRHKQLKKKSGLSTFYMLEASTPVSYRGERAASSPAGSAVFGVGGGGEMPRTGSASQV